MKRIIVFYFYKDFAVCENRLRILQFYNPETQIFGLFGGEDKQFPAVKRRLRSQLQDLYCVTGRTSEWKWKNHDLALNLWYREQGKDINFDVLHLIEWDLLLFESVSKLYKNIPANGVGLAWLTPLSKIEWEWDWTRHPLHRTEWKELLQHARDRYQYTQEPYGCLSIGPCLPRGFLEKYCTMQVPELCHVELRLPLFSQILGFRLYDTGFYRKEEKNLFNADKKEIEATAIETELSDASGRRVFHPFYGTFTPDKFGNWKGAATRNLLYYPPPIH